MHEISMRKMRVDQKGIVTSVKAEGQLGRRIRDLGLIAGTEIRIVGRAPLYDPVALRLNGYTLTLRNREADYIFCNTEE
ncbi:MAG: iron transporter FeoA [Desulfobacterales bacterium]|nr:MAG: iron transporter FeoA [Desulfobacterales bacterium]